MPFHLDLDTRVVFATIGPHTTRSLIQVLVNQLPAEGTVYWKYQTSTIFNEIDAANTVIYIPTQENWLYGRNSDVDFIYVPDPGDTGYNGTFDFTWTSGSNLSDGRNSSFDFIVDGTRGTSLNTPVPVGVNGLAEFPMLSFNTSSQNSISVRVFQYPDEGTIYYRYDGSEELHLVERGGDFVIYKRQTLGDFEIERFQFIYFPPADDTGFNGTFSYQTDFVREGIHHPGQVYKYDFIVDRDILPSTAIQDGDNTGTSGDDLFEVKVPNLSFFLDGGAGDDTLRADLADLSSWRTVDVETLEFYGSRETPFQFSLGEGGSSRTANVSATTSQVLVDIQSSGSTIYGGLETYLDARDGHVITNFDMSTGIYEGTYNGAQMSNRYLNLNGVLGGAGNDVVAGTAGSDRVFLSSGVNSYDGRGGVDDLIVVGSPDDFSITTTTDGFQISRNSDPTGDVTTATNVERVVYTDSNFNETGYRGVFNGARSDYVVFSGSDGNLTVAEIAPDNNVDPWSRLENVDTLVFSDGTMSSAEALLEPEDPDDSAYQVYRFFNRDTGSHFYTTSILERNSVIQTVDELTFEGNAFDSNVTEANGIPVYRFYNVGTRSHFYTADPDEAFTLRFTPGFREEGISYYAASDNSYGASELYRFLNTQNGTHFFTTSEAERDNIIGSLPHYNYEGVAYYVDLA